MALKWLALVVAIYAVVVLIIYVAQTALLFPVSMAGGARAMPHGTERLACETPDGEHLQGIRFPSPPGDDRVTVLGFGGNAWNADDMAVYLRELFPAAEVVTFHYRGYPPSTGRPSAEALLDDAPVFYDCLIKELNPARRIIAVGFSIGSGVAIRLARERPVDGLILVTPFDTLEGLARHHYGWLPVGLLLRHHMFPVDELREVSAPVALIVAERDSIIPKQRTAPLRKAARNLVMDQIIPGAGHNDVYANPDFTRSMHHAMELLKDQDKATQFPMQE